jgi:hypothetical protein
MVSVVGAQVFYNIDLISQGVSALVALLVAYFAFKGYILTKNRTSLFFSASFFLITMGLLTRMLFDFLAKFELAYNTKFFASLYAVPVLSGMLAASIFFMAAGYAILLALFYKIRSKSIIVLLILLVGMLAAFSNDSYYQVHIIPAVMLLFLQFHTIENFAKKTNANTLLVLASFFLLFVSELSFLLLNQSITFYFVGNTLRLMSYLLLLANLFLVFKQ